MKKNSGNALIITLLVIAIIAAFIAWKVMSPGDATNEGAQQYSLTNSSAGQSQTQTDGTISDAADQKAGYEKLYTNTSFGFSFMYPKDVTVGSFQQGEGTVFLVQSTAQDDGVQIVITPFEGDANMTAARIRSDIPDLKIANEKSIPLASGSTALAFTTDYSSFGGPSANIWFVYKGNLYQLSAPSSSGAMLSGLFSTWKFAR